MTALPHSNQPAKHRVLFLCTGNSCRSQMAEAWTHYLYGATIAAASAGTQPQDVDTRAVQVMAEVGINIAGRPSKSVADVLHIPFDTVVTVCREAHEICPVFPGQTRLLHMGFDDPPRLAATVSTPEAALTPYRRVRDEIRAFVVRLPDILAAVSR